MGIVASRLSEKFSCPSFMIHLAGGMGKGSCRSYGGFNLFDALSACAEYLEGFGGHALAAGLNIKRDKLRQFDTTPSDKGKWYILGLSGYESGSYAGIINPWTPIGTANKVFAGSFDGRGHTISGLFIENYMYAGLFGYADGVNIADVNIKDSVAVSSDRGYTGIVAGYLNGNVSRCNITDSIAASTAEGYVGGITGYAADAPLEQDGTYKENHLYQMSRFQ